jgi:hypothetical protein
MQRGGIVLKRRTLKKHVSLKSNVRIKNNLYRSVTFAFNLIADINKWDQKEALQAADEYFRLIHMMKVAGKHSRNTSKAGGQRPGASRHKAGGASASTNVFYKFASWLYTGSAVAVDLLIGKFDTPCNIILSLLAVGVWSVVVYNAINNVLPEDAKRSLAQPAQYIIYNVNPDFYHLEEEINAHVVNYVERNVSIPLSIIGPKEIVGYARTFFYEPILYKNIFELPITCVLQYKIESCNERCRLGKKTKTKSKSKSKSTKSKYYTPL